MGKWYIISCRTNLNFYVGKLIEKCFLYGTQKKTFPWAPPFRKITFPSEKCYLSPVAKDNLFHFVSLEITNSTSSENVMLLISS